MNPTPSLEIVGFAAVCKECEEHFEPVNEHDLVHVVDSLDRECYGQGKLIGYWGRVR